MEDKLLTLANLEEYNRSLDTVINSKLDLTNYYDKTQVDNLLKNKQNTISLGYNLYGKKNYSNYIQAIPVESLSLEESLTDQAIRFSSYRYWAGGNGCFATIYSKKIYYIDEVMRKTNSTAFLANRQILSSYTGDYQFMEFGNGIFLIKTDFSNTNYGFFYAHHPKGDIHPGASDASFRYYAVPENLVGITFNEMVFVKDRFILYTTDGTQMFWSKDGKDWTQVTLPVEGAIKRLMEVDNKIGIVQGNKITLTRDFETYETLESNVDFSTAAKDVEYFKGRYYYLDTQSSVYLRHSADLQTWNYIDFDISRTGYRLFKNKDVLLISYGSYTSLISYTFDGHSVSNLNLNAGPSGARFVDTGKYIAILGETNMSVGMFARLHVREAIPEAKDIKCVGGVTIQDKLDDLEEALENGGSGGGIAEDTIYIGEEEPTDGSNIWVKPSDLLTVEGLLNTLFPIGKVEIFFDNEDHSNHLGFTWERTSVGRTPVGISEGSTNFGEIGKTGGQTQVTAPLQSHSHSITQMPKYQNTSIGTGTSSSATVAVLSGTQQLTTTTSGTSSPYISVLQPYEVMAFWKRIG